MSSCCLCSLQIQQISRATDSIESANMSLRSVHKSRCLLVSKEILLKVDDLVLNNTTKMCVCHPGAQMPHLPYSESVFS